MTEHRLNKWLEDNVILYPEPKNITLSRFEVDWDELSGSFTLSLDSVKIEPRFKCSLDTNGWMRFWMPQHHSPLGVPASYPAIEITNATEKAIECALKEVFGRFRPFGLNKDIDKLITSYTPTLDRLLPGNSISSIKTRLESNQSISKAV